MRTLLAALALALLAATASAQTVPPGPQYCTTICASGVCNTICTGGR
jgi:hypothetical protein